MVQCEYCNRVFGPQSALSIHLRYCQLNPNRKPIVRDQDAELLRRQRISETAKLRKKSGGLRQGSGRGKKGWYKGYFCDSTYELAFVIYNIDHNINFERNLVPYTYVYENEEHKYFPDFLMEDGSLVEIKGRVTDVDFIKWAAVKDRPLKILRTSDLQDIFKYVKENYQYDALWELYEVKHANYEIAPKHKPKKTTNTNKKKRKSRAIKKTYTIPDINPKIKIVSFGCKTFSKKYKISIKCLTKCEWCGKLMDKEFSTIHALKVFNKKSLFTCSESCKHKYIYYRMPEEELSRLQQVKVPQFTFNHSDATKSKLSKNHSGSLNNQYGKHWYHDPITNENICCFENEKPSGWVKGRKFQYSSK